MRLFHQLIQHSKKISAKSSKGIHNTKKSPKVINGSCIVLKPLKQLTRDLKINIKQSKKENQIADNKMRKMKKEQTEFMNKIKTGYKNPYTHYLNIN